MRIKCGTCSTTLQIPTEAAGRKVKCPKCSSVLQTPTQETPEGVRNAGPAPSHSQGNATPTSKSAGAQPKGMASQKSQVTANTPGTQPARQSSVSGKPPAAQDRSVAGSGPASATGNHSTKTSNAQASTTHASRQPSTPSIETYTKLHPHVLASFDGKIQPVRAPISYQLSILLVSAVMILLPLIYISLIVGAGYLVYWHATNNLSMFRARTGARGILVLLMAYLAPIVIGAILVLFMIKPLFARSAKEGRRRSLTRDGEPLLFDFVDRICEAVGSPRPNRIDINCEVNAFAAFRRGMLSFLGSDLILMIGMPLVAGLTMRQFAGVLAHEFGHFSQGAGMRLSYVIRSIAHWFQRVVYERDAWDDWLKQTAGEVDIRIGLILYLAMFFVWVTRKILWVLMVCGFAVSGVLLRQMEFDADRYEARLAGSKTFESTARQLSVLGLAYQGAQADLSHFHSEGRLADSLPKLIHANVDQIPKTILQKIAAQEAESKTGLFDTHPCNRDRIANAHRENAPGIFALELPASRLFQHYDAAARNVTWDLYCALFGGNVQQEKLHSTDQLLVKQKQDHVAIDALSRILQGQFQFIRPYPPLEVRTVDASSAKDVAASLRDARRLLMEGLAQYQALRKKEEALLEKYFEAAQLIQLSDASVKPNPKDYQTPVDGISAKKGLQSTQGKLDQLYTQTASWEFLASQRISLAVSLIFYPPLAGRIEQAHLHQATARRLLPAANRLLASAASHHRLHVEFIKLTSLLPHLQTKQEDEYFIRNLLKQMKVVCDTVNAVRDSFQVLPYPLDHAQQGTSIAAYLLREPLLDAENLGKICDEASGLLSRLATLTSRVMAQLALVTEKVESAIGLPPLPEPSEDKEGD